MIFIKKFNENFEVDRFNKFIKKYKKTDYISTNSKKYLLESGINLERLENLIDDSLEFISNFDEDLFRDFLDDILFEVDFDFGFELSYYLELDDTYYFGNSPSRVKFPVKESFTKKDFLERIIKLMLDRKYSENTPSFAKFSLKKRFDNCKIYPSLRITLDNPYNDYYLDIDEEKIKKLIIQVHKNLGNVMPSYLSQIGYSNMQARVYGSIFLYTYNTIDISFFKK